jgi:hypothetical protein
MSSFLEQRFAHAATLGAGILDLVHATVACRHCSRYLEDPREDPVVRVMPTADYRDLDGLVQHARGVASNVFALPSTPCPTCGSKTSIVSVDFHAWHSAMGRDLVVRAHKRLFAVETELLWWCPSTGHVAASALTERQRHVVRRDATFRRIRAASERGGIRTALAALEEAVQFFRGDPDLLQYAPQLLGAGKADLLGHIATLHISLHKRDPDGYFWLALAIYDNVNRGVLTSHALVQAEAHLRTALELRDDFADADCALCNVARARGDLPAARRCFERAIDKYPANPRLFGDLAALELATDPISALAHFTRAESLAPNDPAYPLGRARALVRLSHYEAAHLALTRVRQLHTSHPQLRDVELAIATAPPPTVEPSPAGISPDA